MLKLGPADHGRALTLEEFLGGEYREGYRYELIEGRLCVSPAPNPPGRILETWILLRLANYAQDNPEVVNFACPEPRVFVPGVTLPVVPRPDVGVYQDFPIDQDVEFEAIRWQDHSPVLVVEVLDADNPDKDLERNVRLYRQVPSIREYWVIDPRPRARRPTLLVRRRSGTRWRVSRHAFGSSYTTPLLPNFSLVVDPRA